MRRRVKSLTALGALLLIATVHLMPEGFHLHILETGDGVWRVTSVACPNESPLLTPATTREISPLSPHHKGHLLFCSTATITPRETPILFTHRSQAPPSALPSLQPTLRI